MVPFWDNVWCLAVQFSITSSACKGKECVSQPGAMTKANTVSQVLAIWSSSLMKPLVKPDKVFLGNMVPGAIDI